MIAKKKKTQLRWRQVLLIRWNLVNCLKLITPLNIHLISLLQFVFSPLRRRRHAKDGGVGEGEGLWGSWGAVQGAGGGPGK